MNSRLPFSRTLLLLVLLPACGPPEEEAPGPAVVERVAVSFAPLAWAAETLARGTVPVVLPLPPGEDPAFWEPSDAALATFQQSRRILLNGAGFERWAATAVLPRSRVVETAAAFRDRWIVREEGRVHSHGGGPAHSHAGLDGHTWLAPSLFREQLRSAARALEEAWPEHRAVFRAGLEEAEAALEDLENRLRALQPALQGWTLLASHPAYDYLAREQGWTIRNFDLDPEAPLTPEQLQALEAARGLRTLMLWEGEPRPETRRALEERGIRSVLYAPGEGPGGPPWPELQRQNLERLAEALGAGALAPAGD